MPTIAASSVMEPVADGEGWATSKRLFLARQPKFDYNYPTQELDGTLEAQVIVARRDRTIALLQVGHVHYA